MLHINNTGTCAARREERRVRGVGGRLLVPFSVEEDLRYSHVKDDYSK